MHIMVHHSQIKKYYVHDGYVQVDPNQRCQILNQLDDIIEMLKETLSES